MKKYKKPDGSYVVKNKEGKIMDNLPGQQALGKENKDTLKGGTVSPSQPPAPTASAPEYDYNAVYSVYQKGKKSKERVSGVSPANYVETTGHDLIVDGSGIIPSLRLARPSGTKVFLQGGVPHRLDGPAIIHPDGTEEYWEYGQWGRGASKPSTVHPDGTKEYMTRGANGRLVMIEYPDGTRTIPPEPAKERIPKGGIVNPRAAAVAKAIRNVALTLQFLSSLFSSGRK